MLGFVCLFLFLCSSPVIAAESAVFSLHANGDGWEILKWVITSGADGAFDDATKISGSGYDALRSGTIERVIIDPAAGANQPDDNFVVKMYSILKGGSSADTTNDLFCGIGAACDQTNTTDETPLSTVNGYPRKIRLEKLVPYASGMGDSNAFTLYVYITGIPRK